jgi:hypothetical protein
MPRYNKQKDFETGLAKIGRFFDLLGFSTSLVEPYRDKEGTFYSARFVLPPRLVEFTHVYSPGPVIYTIREFSVEHTHYVKALGVSSEAQFPSFEDDSVSGYTALLHDLQTVLSPFFTGQEEAFIAIASQYMEQQNQQFAHATRDLNYRAIQEPRLKAQARELFFQGRYREVVQLESQIRFLEFLSKAERQLFDLARKRQ